MSENRLARELEGRSQSERPKSWQQAGTLPDPDKQPGYSYRWIRVSSLGLADPRNVSSKMRQGWEAVLIEEQPKFKTFADPNSRYKHNIEIGGLLLCKIPTEFMEQRREYHDKVAKAQMVAVDNNFMKENDARMPLFAERRSTTSFGKGK